MCVLFCEREIEASVAYKKTGFVYADAQTVQLARLNCNTLRALSLVNTHEK